MASASKIVIISGAVLIIAGLVLKYLPGIGRLPGDIVIRRGTMTLYIPVMTSLVISVIVSLLMFLFMRR